MDEWVQDFIDPQSIIGTIGFIVVLVIWWRKDAANPSQAASLSVVTSSAQYASTVYGMATSAVARADSAEKRVRRAERLITVLVNHIGKLERMLEQNGIETPTAPIETLDYASSVEDEPEEPPVP